MNTDLGNLSDMYLMATARLNNSSKEVFSTSLHRKKSSPLINEGGSFHNPRGTCPHITFTGLNTNIIIRIVKL